MLKSRYKINMDDDVEEEEEHQVVEEHQVEEEHHVVEEEAPARAERVLKRSEVSVRLSVLGKTADGDGYTYLKATCTKMGLTNIKALTSFKHLQFVDVSNNNLNNDDIQVLSEIEFLVLIHADNNVIQSASLKRMKYLQVIIMNHNNIKAVNDVFQPELSTLEVGYNKIEVAKFDNRMPQVKCLDFRYNLLKDIEFLDFPNLDSLYLAGNKIAKLTGIERLVNLRILHLRNNPIKLLDGFEECHVKLQYLNLRNCRVLTLRQLKKLRVLPSLETLILKGCPYMGGAGVETTEAQEEEDDAELRVEVLATLPRVKRLNKVVAIPEERAEAEVLMKTWLEEGEKDEEEIEDEQALEEETKEQDQP